MSNIDELLLISFFLINKPSVAPCCLHITCIAKVKSGESYPNRVVNFELNRAYMKILTPNSCCTDNTWLLNIFMDCWDFYFGDKWTLRRSISKSLLCIRQCISVFFCICNVSKYCFLFDGKRIKSNMGNKFYLQMIFICVRLNWLDILECHTIVKQHKSLASTNHTKLTQKLFRTLKFLRWIIQQI